MNREVQASVLSALSEYTMPNSIDLESLGDRKLADIVNDSLSLLEVIYELEDTYGITIKHESLTRLETITDLVTAVDGELNSASVSP